jgi:hypothetical protein
MFVQYTSDKNGGKGGGSSLIVAKWEAKYCISTILTGCVSKMSTSTQLLLLIFALKKARTMTRRDQHHKAVAARMMYQFHEMPVPVFRRISISSHQNTAPLLKMLLLSTREARESPSGDLDPLNSLIKLRISSHYRDTFHLEAAFLFNECHRDKMCSQNVCGPIMWLQILLIRFCLVEQFKWWHLLS